MSYTMTHLIIADQYIERHGITATEAKLFLLASISPDSVHANADFNPHMKELSHFFPEEIKWGTICKEEQMDRWYTILQEFYQARYSENLTSKELAFLQGYTIHLLVDIFNCQYFYIPNLIQYGLDVPKFRKDYREQSIAQDYFLYQTYERSKAMFEEMKSVVDVVREHSILERLNLQEQINVDSIYRNLLHNESLYDSTDTGAIKDMYMITPESTNRFLQEVGEKCDELLFDLPERAHLFEINSITDLEFR